MAKKADSLARAFVWRRWHSLTGLWLVLFLIIHLLTNSQAALFIGENGSGFIKAVNDIRALPYLQVIEILLLAVPFAIHTWWGIKYIQSGEYNSFRNNGSKPSLDYPRNYAYTWQRLTSWILLVLITGHVVQMRFLEAPTSVQRDAQKYYMVRVNDDSGLYPLSARLGFKLYDQGEIAAEKESLDTPPLSTEKSSAASAIDEQRKKQQQDWLNALNKYSLQAGQLLAVSKDFGTAELLMVRETFKMPSMIFLYTVLVLSACFHAFNGLWTFCITWGLTLSEASQNKMKKVAFLLMFVVTFLGLATIWGTYWINLYS